eukprot:11952278-Alexandrium_andersonii.AAC.1
MGCPAVHWRATQDLAMLWNAVQCRARDVQCALCAQSSASSARCIAHVGACSDFVCAAAHA